MPGEDVDRGLSTGRGVRTACRAGGFAGTTSGIAPGFVQGNLAVLPRDLAGELPVFPGGGVTPQSVIEAALPPFAITHAPGCMLVTDRRNTEFAIL